MGDIAFEALAEPPRLRVADTVGNEQYTLHLDSPVEPEPVSTEGFTYPVSEAVEVEMSGFELDGMVWIQLWGTNGELLHTVERDDQLQVPPDEYYLELSKPVKTYLKFSGGVEIGYDADGLRVQFGTPTSVTVGARSPRKQPVHSITTTEAPTDIMQAFSYLGEGLMTTSPSRSYPSLRAYPPEINLGDEFAVPSDIERGPKPITLTVPPVLEYVYEAAPLTYYLDADLEPGSEPRILVDGASVRHLDPRSFSEEVESMLRHVFVLDCIVRSVGVYPIETLECTRLVDDIPYDLSELYHADPEARLRMYLDVPFEPVARESHEWPATAHVEPIADTVTNIPHVVAQLAPIRAVSPERLSGTEARQAALKAFIGDGSRLRAASEVFSGEASFVEIDPCTSSTDIWVGPDIPIDANKHILEGFQNRFRRQPSSGSSIDVTIVCNEAWMDEEATTVEDLYGERGELPFDVTIHEHLDRASLSALLQTENDFLHYIGHANATGLECRDGYLDVSTVSSIGVDTFFLNACQSYRQAVKLVEGGAIGGIATLSDITDDQAVVVGRTVARLLDLGFPLRGALEIACSRSVVGGQYLAVGDDSVALVPTNNVPSKCTVNSIEGGYELTLRTNLTSRAGAGGMFSPWLGSEVQRFLLGKSMGPYELSAAELGEYLEHQNLPVEFDGEFRWAFDLAEELD